jgi:RNA polymerase sigma factor (sigma-70 family)
MSQSARGTATTDRSRLGEAEELLAACYATRVEAEARGHFRAFTDALEVWIRRRALSLSARLPVNGRAERAEDVTQVVLLRVWRTWGNAGSRWDAAIGPLRAWLGRLIEHASIDQTRKEMRHPATPFSQLGPGAEVRRPGPTASPHEDVALAQFLAAFLTGLPDRDRRLLELKGDPQLNQGEIAERLGVSDSVVSQRLAKLRRKFVALLAG